MPGLSLETRASNDRFAVHTQSDAQSHENTISVNSLVGNNNNNYVLYGFKCVFYVPVCLSVSVCFIGRAAYKIN